MKHVVAILSVGALATFGACSLAACAAEDVVIANIPADSDGGKPEPPAPCVKDDDCSVSQFCERSTCSDQVGHCRNKPPFCDSTSDTVCGCDGVTYWNDCLRESNGVSKDIDGICASGITCDDDGGAAPCGNAKASCGTLFFHQDQCGLDVHGLCWVLPDSCPTGAQTDWASCGSPFCTDVCTAIRSGARYFRTDGNNCH